MTIGIGELWQSPDEHNWIQRLARYWDFVRPDHLELERALDKPDLERIRGFDAQGWYRFLHDEYFRWKYTTPNRYASTTRHLEKHVSLNELDDLCRIKDSLLNLDLQDTEEALATARRIRGLGVAGASGLLAIMYPCAFGTVDQFVVKALRQVEGLPQSGILDKMNPEQLTEKDGVLLIKMMRAKAEENNHRFQTATWTPRKIDMILWTYGR